MDACNRRMLCGEMLLVPACQPLQVLVDDTSRRPVTVLSGVSEEAFSDPERAGKHSILRNHGRLDAQFPQTP